MSRKKKGRKDGGGLLKVLSRPPKNPWPEGFVHHGARVGLLVLLAVVVTALFPSGSRRTVTSYDVGMVATEDIIAEVGFSIPKTEEELEREQAEAEASVPPIFNYRPEARDSMASRLQTFYDELERVVQRGGQQDVERFLTRKGIPVTEGQAEQFLDPANLQALREASFEVTRELIPLVLDSNDAALIGGGRIVVRDESGMERAVGVDSLLWGREFLARALGKLEPATPELEAVFRLILLRFFEPSYVLDVVATEMARSQARQAVPTEEDSVVAGEAIVRGNQRIGEEELERLLIYERALRQQGMLRELGRDWAALTGSGLLNLLLLSVFGLLLYFFRTEVYRDFRSVSLQALLVFTYFLAGGVIAAQEFPFQLLPIVFAVLPVAVLWDGRMALVLALVLGVITGAQPPFSQYSILVVTLVGGAAAALSARAIRRRSQTWIFIALITLGYALAIVALGLVDKTEPRTVLYSILWAAGNTTASAILAMGFMPVFEWYTGITTDQTLLEWADPNRPLLKRLSLEAGGTYAHTINVANLAEAGATAIEANGLLARVGVYYHDVGKILKPQFFVENQPGSRNPHDKLKPHTSAAIVKEHVVEGERLAREEGVPEIITRFIPEHHGTQLIGFFYEKAKEESEEEPDPDEFRYPGPKPRSKETAISMLADSVESATRAVQDPSPERLREVIRTVVDGKIQDGQLAEAPLTLREIDQIVEQFAKVVGGMFHHRLDYPATKHLTESHGDEEAGGGPGGQEADEASGKEAGEDPDTAQEDTPRREDEGGEDEAMMGPEGQKLPPEPGDPGDPEGDEDEAHRTDRGPAGPAGEGA